MTPQDIFTKAHELALNHGLTKGRYSDKAVVWNTDTPIPPDACFCTHGFMIRAGAELEIEYGRPEMTKAFEIIDTRLKQFENRVTCAVVAWSDHPDRKIEDVQQLFAELAQ